MQDFHTEVNGSPQIVLTHCAMVEENVGYSWLTARLVFGVLLLDSTVGCSSDTISLANVPSDILFDGWPIYGALEVSDQLSLRVVDRFGSSVNEAHIGLNVGDGLLREMVTDIDGRVEFPDVSSSNRFDIHVAHPNYQPTSWLGVPVGRCTISLSERSEHLVGSSEIMPVRVHASLPEPPQRDFFLALSDLRIVGETFRVFDEAATELDTDLAVLRRDNVALYAQAGYRVDGMLSVAPDWNNLFAWGFAIPGPISSGGSQPVVNLAMYPIQPSGLLLLIPANLAEHADEYEWRATYQIRIEDSVFPGAIVPVHMLDGRATLPSPRIESASSQDFEYVLRLVGSNADSGIVTIAEESQDSVFTARRSLDVRQVRRIDRSQWLLGERDPNATLTVIGLETGDSFWSGVIFDGRQKLEFPASWSFEPSARATGTVYDLEYVGPTIPWTTDEKPELVGFVHSAF
jgi:hypothetical protein